MNRFHLGLLIAAAVCVAASCAKDAATDGGAVAGGETPAADSTRYVTRFTASFSEDTKVLRNSEGKSEWVEGDEISIYYRDSDGDLIEVPATADNAGATATFTLVSPIPTGMESGYLATYPSNFADGPFPAEDKDLTPENLEICFDNKNIEASFENAAICAASTSVAGGNLEFKNICSILKFTTTNANTSRVEAYVGGQKCTRSVSGASTYYLPIPKDVQGITLRLSDSKGWTYPAFSSSTVTAASKIYNIGNLEDRVLTFTGSTTQPLRLMSFNILRGDLGGTDHLWTDRKASCLDMLSHNVPDLLGLQECTYTQRCDILNDNLRYGVVGVSVKGQALDYTNVSSNPIFYDGKKFLLERWGTFWLSETPDTPGSYTFYCTKPRAVTWAQFLIKGGTQHLVYICTHLQNNADFDSEHQGDDTKWGKENRTLSVQLICDRLPEINPQNYPMLLSADFNRSCDAEELTELYSHFSLVADLATTTDTGNTYNGFTYPTGKSRIDHIFSNFCSHSTFAVDRDTYEGVQYISDHWPVYTDFCTGVFSSSLDGWTTDDITQ